jgi:hypothetical protein
LNQTPSSLVCAASASLRRPTARAPTAESSLFSTSLVQGEAADPVQGGGHVRAVVDRLADVGEVDVGEPVQRPGSLSRPTGRRARTDPLLRKGGYWSFGCSEELADGDVPFVALAGLPDHHYQPPTQAQRPPDVGERGGWVVGEHRAEPADRQVEALVREAAVLRVGAKATLRGSSSLAGTLDRGRGDVDPSALPSRHL